MLITQLLTAINFSCPQKEAIWKLWCLKLKFHLPVKPENGVPCSHRTKYELFHPNFSNLKKMLEEKFVSKIVYEEIPTLKVFLNHSVPFSSRICKKKPKFVALKIPDFIL